MPNIMSGSGGGVWNGGHLPPAPGDPPDLSAPQLPQPGAPQEASSDEEPDAPAGGIFSHGGDRAYGQAGVLSPGYNIPDERSRPGNQSLAPPGYPSMPYYPQDNMDMDGTLGSYTPANGTVAHTLGLTVIGVAAGALLGGKYGGVYGSIAGSVLAGAAVNAYRAYHHYKVGTEESDREAKISGTYAVGAAVLGGVIWAKLASPSKQTFISNPSDADDDSDADEVFSGQRCKIRKVGP